jgi:hypothetical protein
LRELLVGEPFPELNARPHAGYRVIERATRHPDSGGSHRCSKDIECPERQAKTLADLADER